MFKVPNVTSSHAHLVYLIATSGQYPVAGKPTVLGNFVIAGTNTSDQYPIVVPAG